MMRVNIVDRINPKLRLAIGSAVGIGLALLLTLAFEICPFPKVQVLAPPVLLILISCGVILTTSVFSFANTNGLVPGLVVMITTFFILPVCFLFLLVSVSHFFSSSWTVPLLDAVAALLVSCAVLSFFSDRIGVISWRFSLSMALIMALAVFIILL